MSSKTSKKQQIAVWIVLILMVSSTIAMYVTMIIGQQNQAKESAEKQKVIAEYQKRTKDYQQKVDVKAKELSAQYYDSFKDFSKNPAAFNAASVQTLTKNDLREGDGVEFNDQSNEFYAYYIGWKPDGTVFDSSFSDDKKSLKIPFAAKKSGDYWPVIKGWSDGLKGMKIGGVRELTIPADQAYGEAGSPNPQDSARSIESNTPLKFIVMLIPKFEEVPTPDLSDLKLEEFFGGNQ